MTLNLSRYGQVEDDNEAETMVESADNELNETQHRNKEEDFMYMKVGHEIWIKTLGYECDNLSLEVGLTNCPNCLLQALYYALPLDYVTISQLQTNLGNEINYLATRKLVEKMVNEGYVEGTMANRKMGKLCTQYKRMALEKDRAPGKIIREPWSFDTHRSQGNPF